ncbi:VOC family protein [Pseudarthrobacter oxydans]|uniref:VOC family protein n=1 Tax=Pseudarthrobacter oxydans TaxID=1671 RepID=UPI003D2893C0
MRDYSGPDLERGTAVPNAALQGVHLRLPGHGDDGPTLEIYTFASTEGVPEAAGIDRPGFRHIAFAVADVHAARRRVLDEGGSSVGEVVTLTTSDGRRVTWCYVTDAEGNALELQGWAPSASLESAACESFRHPTSSLQVWHTASSECSTSAIG